MMLNPQLSTEHRAHFGSASFRGERVHFIVELLPESEECDWLVWKHDSSSIKRSRKPRPVSMAMAEAEQAARTMLMDAVRLVWHDTEPSESPGSTQMTESFKIAAGRAQAAFPADVWRRMSTHEQADELYNQLRILDLERVDARTENPDPGAGSGFEPAATDLRNAGRHVAMLPLRETPVRSRMSGHA